MRWIVLFLLAGCSGFLLSCEKGGDTSFTHNPNLTTGQWQLVEAGYTDTIMPAEQKVPYAVGSYLDFDGKGNFSASVNDSVGTGEWHYLEAYASLFIMNRNGSSVENDNYRIEWLTEHSLVLLAYKHAGIAEKRLYLEK